LNIGHNYINSIVPSWIADLRQLRALNLADNAFTGVFPSELLELEELGA
jgi:hypothetical protein